MKFPKDSIKSGRNIFQASFTDGVLDQGKVRKYAEQLVRTKPRHYIPTLRYLQKLVRLELQSRHVHVESAAPLDPQQQRSLIASLEDRYGAGLTSEFTLNPDLLGGARVHVGSDVYDGSVRGRLNQLKQSFAH